MLVSNATRALASWAPLAYQEPYDNSGLLVGDESDALTGVLVSLDLTEAVIEEALSHDCNLLVSHHPLLFKPIKRLTPQTTTGRLLLRAAREGLCVYAIHTNLDNVSWGLNASFAQRLGLQNCRVLLPKPHMLGKLVVFVPMDAVEPLMDALHEAGAGAIGNYTRCGFSVLGEGRFMPNTSARPQLGEREVLSKVSEQRVEVIFPWYRRTDVLAAMRSAHPYEEVAYYLHHLENTHEQVGSGIVGDLPAPCEATAFLSLLKERFALALVRHTAYKASIRRVALCGGAGAFLTPYVPNTGADAYVTADVKYHEFFLEEENFMLCDIGHYESEAHVQRVICAHLEGQLKGVVVRNTVTCTNPVCYYF